MSRRGSAVPTLRLIRSTIPVTNSSSLEGFGTRVCRREKARSLFVRLAARLVAPCASHDVPVDITQSALRQALGDNLQASADAGKDIVEIVSEATGQLSYRLHFLALPQRLLGLLQLRLARFDMH